MRVPCHVGVEPVGPVVQLDELLRSTTCITRPFMTHLDVTYLVYQCLFESEMDAYVPYQSVPISTFTALHAEGVRHALVYLFAL